MTYRRAISTLGCPELPLEQALTLARCHSLDAGEVRALLGSTDVPTVFAATYGNPTVWRTE